MKNLIYYSFLILLIISCQENNSKNGRSDFKLKKDYAELTSKMTNLDTVKISIDLSICGWDRQETIQLTKSEDSLEVHLIIKDLELGDSYQDVKLNQKYSNWNIESFLIQNQNRIETHNTESNPRMIVSSNTDSLKLYTNGLVDANQFIANYYKLMYHIDPKNEFYKNAVQQDSIN